jgi:hypothetical protein
MYTNFVNETNLIKVEENMDLTVLIEVAIGIMFVWILLALITSQIQDWVSQALSWKANMLEESIQGLLGDDAELRKKFYEHPLIQSLHTNGGSRKPAGIPADKFALVLFDVFMRAGSEESLFAKSEPTFEKLHKSITGLRESSNPKRAEVARSLDTLLMGLEDQFRRSNAGIAEARKRVEDWFDNAMDRLSGSYVRRMQIISIFTGLLVAVILNADTVAIVNKLWKDPLTRQAVADQAKAFELPSQNQGTPPTPGDVAAYVDQLQGFPIPLGWTAENLPKTPADWPSKVIGILLSGIAAAQGAPFWFDIIRKLINKGGGSTQAAAPAPAPIIITTTAPPADTPTEPEAPANAPDETGALG